MGDGGVGIWSVWYGMRVDWRCDCGSMLECLFYTPTISNRITV
jgi:hypothetical protein